MIGGTRERVPSSSSSQDQSIPRSGVRLSLFDQTGEEEGSSCRFTAPLSSLMIDHYKVFIHASSPSPWVLGEDERGELLVKQLTADGLVDLIERVLQHVVAVGLVDTIQ